MSRAHPRPRAPLRESRLRPWRRERARRRRSVRPRRSGRAGSSLVDLASLRPEAPGPRALEEVDDERLVRPIARDEWVGGVAQTGGEPTPDGAPGALRNRAARLDAARVVCGALDHEQRSADRARETDGLGSCRQGHAREQAASEGPQGGAYAGAGEGRVELGAGGDAVLDDDRRDVLALARQPQGEDRAEGDAEHGDARGIDLGPSPQPIERDAHVVERRGEGEAPPAPP